MRTSTWNQEWIYGLYESASEAENFIRQAESEGVQRADLVVLGPQGLRHPLVDIAPEKHHPEWKWAIIGVVIGFGVGNIAGHLLIHALNTGLSWVAAMLFALIPGVGGAVAGGFFGIQLSSPDASLNALYEESGAEGKIMVAVRCNPKRKDQVDQVEQIFFRCGVKPIEFPHIGPRH
jgi:hypothetical protein